MSCSDDVSLPVGGTGVVRIALSYSEQVALDQALLGPAINNATVTFSLFDAEGLAIVEDLSVPYLASSEGVYTEEFNPDPPVVSKGRYRYVWKATLPSGATKNVERWLRTKNAC